MGYIRNSQPILLVLLFTLGFTTIHLFILGDTEAIPRYHNHHFEIPVAVASGKHVYAVGNAMVDYSHTYDGYIMVRFSQESEAVRALITGPNGVRYQYPLQTDNQWVVLPLTEGNGYYEIIIAERIVGNHFAVILRLDLYVIIDDPFAPFLRPNLIVNFNADSHAVEKANILTYGLTCDKAIITAIYTFITQHITYDHVFAQSVQSGYIPNIDNVLARGRGICFDYAALMTAMLRSQGIPTKLVIGYVGALLHTWVNVFDGNSWVLLDPTFTANASPATISRFTDNGASYQPRYIH